MFWLSLKGWCKDFVKIKIKWGKCRKHAGKVQGKYRKITGSLGNTWIIQGNTKEIDGNRGDIHGKYFKTMPRQSVPNS